MEYKNFGQKFESKPVELESEQLVVRLKNLAEQLPITPRQLLQNELPKIKPQEKVGPKLETAYLEAGDSKQKRLLFYGDGHGLIFPFLNESVKKEIVQLPLRQILNIDYHVDIAPYKKDITYSHTASWLRYGVDAGFWDKDNSYNCRPEHSTAAPQHGFNPERFIRSISIEQLDSLTPDILSIDIDFFNDLDPKNPKFSEYLEMLKKIISRSKCVFVFSSSGYVLGRVSIEALRTIVENIQSEFLKGKNRDD